ncbi:duf1445 domain protein [Moniliophthora roreri MCA 2997]|uniref:Duf1445 domain protein n=1 Tax=Moniliophthora roreri (strain MCA 2997) TaxID=1381753 RepID=V2WWP4_MONRO|nr:duf1445 domain protein [Moniliophthora roreri MCA 2997]
MSSLNAKGMVELLGSRTGFLCNFQSPHRLGRLFPSTPLSPITMPVSDSRSLSPAQVRSLCRQNNFQESTTASFCNGYVQANLIILPEKYAEDFRNLCARNPVSCPLIGETRPGDPRVPDHLAANCDIRTDLPRYNIYRDGKFVEAKDSIEKEWKSDSIAFLIGCSYSFEAALCTSGLTPRHVEIGRNVPMYKTQVSLMPAGVFSGRMIVSMRPYPAGAVDVVRAITRPYVRAHGEPVAWGVDGARALGIDDIIGLNPDHGDPSDIRAGEVPVYWGCGVTPQQVVIDSGIPGTVISHAPGHMLVLDQHIADVCRFN